MTALELLRAFAKKHPGAPMPGGLWLAALDEERGPVGEMKTSEAARYAGGRSERTIREACIAGEIPGAYQEADGGRWRIPMIGLRAYLDRRQESNAPVRRKHGPRSSAA